MSLDTGASTSRRGYLNQDELADYANITIDDSTEADERISQAEELIDAWVGYHDKWMDYNLTGKAASGGSNTITLQSNQQNSYDNDYFKLCEVEIIGGTGAGQRAKCTGSVKTTGVLTVDITWDTNPDSTSFYKIYQLGKFPRIEDVVVYSETSPTTVYKSIPEAVKRAVAAQVEFMIEMGDSYFAGDGSDKESERIGDYSYSRGGGAGVHKLIAPKAKMLLRGIKNRLGRIVT